ncbi:phosphoglycerate mutase [Roseibium aquae]|uniref:Phosphoglycerate mutase n=1 Tax=Roseibium aquae TaxID=1323746 RepID=A0A916X2M2_9HYPH|nr:histidine phosphatase family protein [Roseibium aquae]GGB51645.1 phosphoglycerate mutase [Roseibium aquae]
MSAVVDMPANGRVRRLPGPGLMIFIRHGQTDWNAEGRMQGRKDIPLNATGIDQAIGNGRRLAAFLQREGLSVGDFDFVASPLDRTRQTMALVRAQLQLPEDGYRLDPRLLEITFGDWEGHTLEELALTEPALVAARARDKWGFTPPNGESYAMLTGRISNWLTTVSEPSIVVAHGGVFRVMRALLEGLDTTVAPKLDVPQDQVFIWRNDEPGWF